MLSDKVIEKIFANKEIQKLDLMTVSLVINVVSEAIEEVEEDAVKQSSIYEQRVEPTRVLSTAILQLCSISTDTATEVSTARTISGNAKSAGNRA